MPAESYDPAVVIAWARNAIPARNVSFDDAGNCLVVARDRFALADTVIMLTAEQLAQACGAFLLKIIAPGLAAAAAATPPLHVEGNLNGGEKPPPGTPDARD